MPSTPVNKRNYNKTATYLQYLSPNYFKNPTRPDSRAYRDYRRYLLETSQIPGGFYSTKGRRQLLRQVVDMMLSDKDPYDALSSGNVPPRQPLRVVS